MLHRKVWQSESSARKASKLSLKMEQLEPRCMLAADPIISEFMARNSSTLADGDGNFSDWIEIHNQGDEAIDLFGWHLTDNSGELDKWTFPSINLGVDEYLVVFASATEDINGTVLENYVDAGNNLHTNFKLTSGGEYLALVKPDGVTIATQFAPQYPEQEANDSYGTGSVSSDPLILEDDSAKVIVPDATLDSQIGDSWTGGAEPFDDSSWTTGDTGIGFPVPSTNNDPDLIGLWQFENDFDDSSPNDFDGIPGGNVSFENDAPAGIGSTAALSLNSNTPTTVIWGSAFEITSNTDILTPANVVDARSFGSNSPINVDVGGETVVFDGVGSGDLTQSLSLGSFFDASGTSVDSDFESVLDTLAATNPGTLDTISYTGLTAGGSYTLQLFLSDDRPGNWSVNYEINGASTNLTTIPGGTSQFVTAVIELGAAETSFDLNLTSATVNVINAAILAETPSAGSDFVDLPISAVNPFDGSSDFAVAAWFKTDGSGDISPILSSSQTGSPTNPSMAFYTGAATVGNGWNDGLIVDYAFSDQTADREQVGVGADQAIDAQDNSWQFGAMNYDSATDTFTVYIYDGSNYLTNSTVISNPFDSALIPNIAGDTVRIGGLANSSALNSGLFSGLIDNLAIFSRELTTTDLDSLRTGDFVPFGIGEPPPDVSGLVTTNISTEMENINSSAYVRMEFNIADQESVDAYTGLNLNMRYDDGFVAYLNGVEVARSNAPGIAGSSLAYNATATSDRSDLQAITPVGFDLSDHISSLQVGTNILAIHGLNVSASNDDFLVLPELFASSIDAGSFVTPTPGSANSQFVTEAPVISVPGNTFTNLQVVEITANPAAEIRYTTDGSVPTASSTLYNGQITITQTTQIRAIAIQPGFVNSKVVGESYIQLAADVEDFTSNIPLIILDNFGGGDVPEKSEPMDFFSMSVFEPKKDTGRAALANQPDLSVRSGMRVRGQTSSNPILPKRQYRFETWTQEDTDLVVSLLGLPADGDWVLSAPYVDKSLFQNPLAFELSEDLGMTAMQTVHFELFLNTDGGAVEESDYRGVYILIERIERHDDRVDIPFLDATDTTEPDITGGYIFKFDPAGFMHNADSYTSQQVSWLNNHISQFESVLYSSNYADPVTGYSQYIDVDSFINLMVMNELIRDADGYKRSNYLYKDREGKIFQGPLWDKNLAFGITGNFNSKQIEGWQIEQSYNASQGWVPRLREDPNFMLKFQDRWLELRQTFLDVPTLMARIDSMAAPLAEAAERNFQKWPILPDTSVFVFGNIGTQTWQEQIDYRKQWLTDRIAWIDSQLLDPPPPTFDPNQGTVSPGTSITIDAAEPIGNSETFDFTTLVSQTHPAVGFVPPDDSLETGAGPYWFDTNFIPTGWESGTAGVGFDENPGSGGDYSTIIGIDLESDWDTYKTSIYSRFEFSLDAGFNPNDIDALTLKMNYDDGFIAYLNGNRIASSTGATASPTFQSHSNGGHGAGTPEEYDVTSFKNFLQPNNNVLAVHALNSSDTSSDLVVVPELLSGVSTEDGGVQIYYTTDGSDPRDTDGNPIGTLYTTPITINESQQFNARSFTGVRWSALSTSLFTVETPLRITELMYHPTNETTAESNAGFDDDDDFEYLELMNVGPIAIPLDGIHFTNGLDYAFPNGLSIDSGERVVLVRDIEAYELRYGTSARIIGEYGADLADAGNKRLANGGETIELNDEAGGTIVSFRYDDKTSEGWYDETDGDGKSLILMDANADNSTFSDAASWRPSLTTNGSPGQNDNLIADLNIDGKVGLSDLLQLKKNFAVGTTPAEGDLTGDNQITTADIAAFLTQYGQSYQPETTAALPPSAPAAASLSVAISELNTTKNETIVDQVITNEFTRTKSQKQETSVQIRKISTKRKAKSVDQAHETDPTTTTTSIRTSSSHRSRRGHRIKSSVRVLTDSN